MCSDLQYIHVMATSREMTSGRPFPLILNFAFPLLLGNLLQQTYSLMDAAIVGKFLGINALASVGASTSVVFLILGFCNGCCGGFGIPVAQKFGARDYGMMRRFVAVSLQLAAVMSVVIAIVTSMFCSDILQMMQTPENILEDAYIEARICDRYTGRFATGIHLNNIRFTEMIPSVTEQLTNGCYRFSVFCNLLNQYCRSGDINNRDEYTGELLDLFYDVLPLVDDAIYDEDMKRRCYAVNRILLMVWAYIKEIAEKAEEKENTSEILQKLNKQTWMQH